MYFTCSCLFHPNQRLDKAISQINVSSLKKNILQTFQVFSTAIIHETTNLHCYLRWRERDPKDAVKVLSSGCWLSEYCKASPSKSVHPKEAMTTWPMSAQMKV